MPPRRKQGAHVWQWRERRRCDAYGRRVHCAVPVRGDFLVCFTTSGNSANCLRALTVAKARGLVTVALLGKDGGQAKGVADFEIIVSHSNTARIQEAHTLILHALLEVVERAFPAV